MSFQISKPKVLDLKRKQPIVSRSGASACGLCKKAEANYSCPECNVPYCSLGCFRSQAHHNCSESFYKTEIEHEIASRPTATVQEKKAMMDILTKFEEQTFADDPTESSDTEDRLSQLEGVDLDTLDVEELWTRLSPAQRAAFEEGIRDPRSSLSKQLLTTIAEMPLPVPWWERREDFGSPTQNDVPGPISIPQGLLDTVAQSGGDTAGRLLFNITAVCLAYVHCIRSFGVSTLASLPSHDQPACQGLVGKLVPFLTDQSSLLLRSVNEARSLVQSRLNDKLPPQLLSDVSFILRPRAVVEIDKEAPLKPQALLASDRIDALTFLSDLSKVFERAPRTPTPTKQRPSYVLHKLTFYAAQVATCPTEVLRTLAEDLHHLANYMETTESGETDSVPEKGVLLPIGPAPGEVDMGIVSGLEPARHRSRPTIEELN